MQDTPSSEAEERLRALLQDEAVYRVSAPRIEQRAREALVRQRSGRRTSVALAAAGPLLIAGGALAALAVAGARAGTHVAGPPTRGTVERSGTKAIGKGMPGLVQVAGAAFPTAGHGIVFVQQCSPCEASSGTSTKWVGVTNDTGTRG